MDSSTTSVSSVSTETHGQQQHMDNNTHEIYQQHMDRNGMTRIVLERAEILRTTGAGIGMQSNGWRALDQLGVGLKLRQTVIHVLREARCLKRSILVKSLANELPVGTIRFGCQIIDVQMDPLTSLPILQLNDGTVIKAKVVIGCDGVNSVIANFIGSKPPNQSTMGGARGFTNYENGHGFSPEFVTINKGHVMLGRFPLDHNLVYWFVARPITPQDLTMSKDKTKIISSTLESVKGFPREMLEMTQNCDVDSLTFNGTQYRAPWELLNARFRKGTVTVVGDAMHVMGPFLGQGGSIALEDAIVLARCLATQRRAEVALDQYIGKRRMRLVLISMKTYAVGTILETSSMVVILLCIVLMVIFFCERLGHTRYDCGRL
ncbi:Monooxygenase 1 [Camellia lanceoleosa]|uniref:Monooxygenase 1 n=1 Tax=Camellia lanceoleosa TaxID=1840588 RepID=A0ACC0GY25_9ERIC|nr:Monooxygenase 1 [Camellia lanceoleosa]